MKRPRQTERGSLREALQGEVGGDGPGGVPAAAGEEGLRLPALLAGAGVALGVLRPDGRLGAANRALEELLGVGAGELAGRLLGDVLDSERCADPAVAEVLAGARRRHSIEGTFRAPGGRHFWGVLTVSTAGAAGTPAALVLLEDASGRRRLEEEQKTLRDMLGAAASEWRATFDAIETPIIILGGNGCAERLNRAARDLAGSQFTDLLGRRLDQMGEGVLWEQAEALVEEVARVGAPRTAEVRDEERRRTWTLAASPALPDLSAARPIILTVREITGLVDLQESLRRSETMAAMGTLLAGVAHEVRNPLFGISAVVDALERRIEGQEDLGRHLAFLRRELRRLEELMADLLDFGRPVSLETEPVSLERMIDEALLACGPRLQAAQVEVTRQAGTPCPAIPLDPQRATQALVNVLENAIHYSPSQGRVEVTTGVVERAGRRWCQVSVHDGGDGFKAADLPRIFEPFFSRRQGGTGLGLPIVVQIVEGHGGEVEAGNAAAGGALVHLRFPLPEEVSR
jgi:PAS domain S-box-containing protein